MSSLRVLRALCGELLFLGLIIMLTYLYEINRITTHYIILRAPLKIVLFKENLTLLDKET